jgi:hypothetical protein
MKGRKTFTRSEANAIIALIRLKAKATSDKQKGIRDKIRNLGFYASDFSIAGGYTERDFMRVVNILGEGIDQAEIKESPPTKTPGTSKRNNSDECFVLDICDAVLGTQSSRQHRFDFLVGDSGVKLPVDAYYEKYNLVIEYKERQHSEPVKFFDRRMTVSGMGRGEQRKKYDKLRLDILPQHGIKVVELFYSDFDHNSSKRIYRNEKVKDIIVSKLSPFKN